VTPHRHGSAVTEYPSELEIVTTREFDAPIGLVFDVLTKPEHVRNWFAPFDCQVTVCSIDLRVGGEYHIVFKTTDGEECSFRGTYLEVEPPSRLVFTWAWHETDDFASPRGQESIVTIQFSPAGERTEMVFTQAVFKEEQARAAHNRGWTESFDKLGSFLGRAA